MGKSRCHIAAGHRLPIIRVQSIQSLGLLAAAALPHAQRFGKARKLRPSQRRIFRHHRARQRADAAFIIKAVAHHKARHVLRHRRRR